MWNAYEHLEKAKVRGAGAQKLLTNIISLIRFALKQTNELVPFDLNVDEKFKAWISRQEDLGREFTPQQIEWLTMIKNHIATSLDISIDVFELMPFYERGGLVKARQLFGDDLEKVLDELNGELI